MSDGIDTFVPSSSESARQLRARWPVVVAVTGLVGLLGLLFAASRPNPVYEATATAFYDQSAGAPLQTTRTIAELMRSTASKERVRDNLHLVAEPRFDAVELPQTNLIRVTARASSAREAIRVADAAVETFTESRRESRALLLDGDVARIRRLLTSNEARLIEAERQLTQRRAGLGVGIAANGVPASGVIIDEALVRRLARQVDPLLSAEVDRLADVVVTQRAKLIELREDRRSVTGDVSVTDLARQRGPVNTFRVGTPAVAWLLAALILGALLALVVAQALVRGAPIATTERLTWAAGRLGVPSIAMRFGRAIDGDLGRLAAVLTAAGRSESVYVLLPIGSTTFSPNDLAQRFGDVLAGLDERGLVQAVPPLSQSSDGWFAGRDGAAMVLLIDERKRVAFSAFSQVVADLTAVRASIRAIVLVQSDPRRRRRGSQRSTGEGSS